MAEKLGVMFSIKIIAVNLTPSPLSTKLEKAILVFYRGNMGKLQDILLIN